MGDLFGMLNMKCNGLFFFAAKVLCAVIYKVLSFLYFNKKTELYYNEIIDKSKTINDSALFLYPIQKKSVTDLYAWSCKYIWIYAIPDFSISRDYYTQIIIQLIVNSFYMFVNFFI